MTRPDWTYVFLPILLHFVVQILSSLCFFYEKLISNEIIKRSLNLSLDVFRARARVCVCVSIRCFGLGLYVKLYSMFVFFCLKQNNKFNFEGHPSLHHRVLATKQAFMFAFYEIISCYYACCLYVAIAIYLLVRSRP